MSERKATNYLWINMYDLGGMSMRFLKLVVLGLVLQLILGGCTPATSVAGGTEAKIADLESENHTLRDRPQ